MLELQQLTQAQQRTTAVAKAAKQSLRDAKAAKPAVLHIQQNEPFDTKAAKGGHAGIATFILDECCSRSNR